MDLLRLGSETRIVEMKLKVKSNYIGQGALVSSLSAMPTGSRIDARRMKLLTDSSNRCC